MRPSQRDCDQLREITLTRQYTRHAEGSVLVTYGETKVICTASIVDGVPRFLKGMNQGWLTAEYGMLPRATHVRTDREATRGKQSGRSLEIQRLIGRTLRNAVALDKVGERTIYIDCDVVQADGGTRTAAITGSCVALADALKKMKPLKNGHALTLHQFIASISVGIYQGQPIVDLDYDEDSNAETDMNVVMNDKGEFIEVQGTAEKRSFTDSELTAMLALAKKGIAQIIEKQKQALAD